jgi:hypothetical protein
LRLLPVLTALIALTAIGAGQTVSAESEQQLREKVAEFRDKTWHWQDKLYKKRTTTSYSERRVKGKKYLKWAAKLWKKRAAKHYKLYASLQDPKKAICYIFGPYCRDALKVAGCESGHTYSVNAQNGQYLGMFQMGAYARSRYGHGYTPLEQAHAAYLYFVASGRDWSPWQCRPWGLAW